MRTWTMLVGSLLAGAGCERDPQSPTPAPGQSAPSTITVFAAASTTDVLSEAGRRFEEATGNEVQFSFDSSSNLARQIKAGAPADLFISADERWMDDVATAGFIEAGTRVDLLGNALVLIAPAGQEFEVTMSNEFEFTGSLPQVTRIAVGDPAHVPAGRYARQALEALGWWDSLEGLLMPALDVRAALRLVELGEANAGIVYSTDAKASDTVVVIAAFPLDTHERITYPIALCEGAAPGAGEFLEFLQSAEMAAVFAGAGFRVRESGNTDSDSESSAGN